MRVYSKVAIHPIAGRMADHEVNSVAYFSPRHLNIYSKINKLENKTKYLAEYKACHRCKILSNLGMYLPDLNCDINVT